MRSRIFVRTGTLSTVGGHRHRSGVSVAMPELYFMAGGDFEIVQVRRHGKPSVE